ncbi:MAG: 1-(5-phosphoribosyl)-5-[(5-phosphoribosylamino)methylideneamino]imidazole-4-carboxamide isomerase [Eubacteriales bacterium]|nr:1-(5-phosphoribosyl)-5-[(5-phosphoribosylamino)methylideneamino]imidazole-4-carboxamide isomerase [Eubacteriales bacterium]
MILYPAIDLYEKQAVRLVKGDYANMTVYSSDPASFAARFEAQGARCLHVVDLEGARDGSTPNLDVILEMRRKTALFIEVGGGIRSMETIERYLSAGIDRIILGTKALLDRGFLKEALHAYGEKIAVGVDILDGKPAVHGWKAVAEESAEQFLSELAALSVKTVICTDISKDGMLSGTNLPLYRELSKAFPISFIASGGVSSASDITALRDMGLYGAILGKAMYEGKLSLEEALAAAGPQDLTGNAGLSGGKDEA